MIAQLWEWLGRLVPGIGFAMAWFLLALTVALMLAGPRARRRHRGIRL